MPAKSQAQQRLFGMVHAYKQGRLPHASSEVKSIAGSISSGDARDFAATRHRGLPARSEKEAAAKQGRLRRTTAKQAQSAISPATRTKLATAVRQAFAAYVQQVAENLPAGTKAAEVRKNSSAYAGLVKLASALRLQRGAAWATATAFPEKTAAARHAIMTVLANGFGRKLASQLKQANLGCTSHPTGGLSGNLQPAAMPGGVAQTSPESSTSIMQPSTSGY